MKKLLLGLALLALGACPARPVKGPAVGTPKVIGEAPALDVAPGISARILIDRESVGSGEAALSVLELQAGAAVAPHVHTGAAELLYLEDGAGELVISSYRERVSKGDTVYIPAGVPHTFTATEGARLIQIYAPGGPEQRFRDPRTPGTIAPGESEAPDPGGAQVLRASAALTEVEPDGSQSKLLLRGAAIGQGSIDLLTITIPAAAPADVHAHDEVSELIYVLRGGGTAILGKEELAIRAGGAYYTPRGTTAGFKPGEETELLVLVVHP